MENVNLLICALRSSSACGSSSQVSMFTKCCSSRGEADDVLWALCWCCANRGSLLPCFTSTGFQPSCTPGCRVSWHSKSVVWSVSRVTAPRQTRAARERSFIRTPQSFSLVLVPWHAALPTPFSSRTNLGHVKALNISAVYT